MAKLFKGLVYLLAILMLVIVLAIIALVVLVNPNNYKDKIVSKVQQTTGRPFSINGDLHWTFFPMFGIEAKDVQLGNLPEFSPQSNFVSVQEASLNVAVKPLWKGEIRFGSLTLNGLNVNLIKNANGDANWQNLNLKHPTPAPTAATQSNNLPMKYKITAASISEIHIKNSNIALDDASTNQHLKVTNLNMTAEGIDFNKSFPLKMTLNVATNHLPNPIPLQFKSNVSVIPDQHQVTFDDLTAGIANMKLTGAINVNIVNLKPSIQGNINIPNFNAKQFLNAFGKNISANALTNVKAQFHLSATPTFISINQLHAQVDESSMNGNISIKSNSTKSLNFTVAVDQFNAARFMNTPTTVAMLSPISDANAATDSSGLLPMDALRALNAKGNLTIGNLIFSSVTAKNVSATLNAQNGAIQINPLSTQLYGGNLQGSLAINAKGATPQWHIVSNFSNIDVGQLLTSSKKLTHIQISGLGNVTADLNTTGNTSDALKQNLNGKAHLEINNGILHGIDIPYYSDLADALINKTQPNLTNTDQTPFGTLSCNWQINNGIASNNDLSMQAPKMKVTGDGTANLITQQLDYHLQLQRLTSGTNIENRGPAIPIAITGPFNGTKIEPDWNALVVTVAKQQISEQIGKHSEDIGKAIGNPELGKQITQGLQSLLGN